MSTQEIAFLDGLSASPIHLVGGRSPHRVNCTLPDSSLSRCKWLETNQQTITQQIVIDGVVLAAFVYHLERTVVSGSAPSAEVVGFQRYKPSPSAKRHGRSHSQPFSLSSLASPPRSPASPHSPNSFFSTGAPQISSSSSPSSHFGPGTGISPNVTTIPTQPSVGIGDAQMPNSMAFHRIPNMFDLPKFSTGHVPGSAFFPPT